MDIDAAGVLPRSEEPIDTWGNKESMNMDNVLFRNVVESPYYVDYLSRLSTFDAVVDEIYYKAKNLDPWLAKPRSASTSWCLLYKLFTLGLSEAQVDVLIQHPDSVYVRGLGFLFLRYCYPPKGLWDWFQPYFNDPAIVHVSARTGDMTIGQFARRLLADTLHYEGTLFPRIPVPVMREIQTRFRDAGLSPVGSSSLSASGPSSSSAAAASAHARPPARQVAGMAAAPFGARRRDHHRGRSNSPQSRYRPYSSRDRDRYARSRSRSRSRGRHSADRHRSHRHRQHGGASHRYDSDESPGRDRHNSRHGPSSSSSYHHRRRGRSRSRSLSPLPRRDAGDSFSRLLSEHRSRQSPDPRPAQDRPAPPPPPQPAATAAATATTALPGSSSRLGPGAAGPDVPSLPQLVPPDAGRKSSIPSHLLAKLTAKKKSASGSNDKVVIGRRR